MKYKTIMLNIVTYAQLAKAKAIMRKKLGKKIGFNDTISELISGRLEFLEIDEKLKDFIARFAENSGAFPFVKGIMLFGSVAKGTYNEYSDIDLLILTKSKKSEDTGKIMKIITDMKGEAYELMDKGLPSLLNPIFIDANDIASFRSFYLDIADYGVILYEDGNSLSSFIYSLKRKSHTRENMNGVEVLTWQ